MSDRYLLDIIMGLVAKRDQHRAYAHSLPEPRRSFEQTAADDEFRAKLEELLATLP